MYVLRKGERLMDVDAADSYISRGSADPLICALYIHAGGVFA